MYVRIIRQNYNASFSFLHNIRMNVHIIILTHMKTIDFKLQYFFAFVVAVVGVADKFWLYAAMRAKLIKLFIQMLPQNDTKVVFSFI